MDFMWKFGMIEGIAELWQELGISAGTAIVILAALYFVIKWAVKNGMMEAYKKIEEKKAQHNLKEDKTVNDLKSGNEDIKGKIWLIKRIAGISWRFQVDRKSHLKKKLVLMEVAEYGKEHKMQTN